MTTKMEYMTSALMCIEEAQKCIAVIGFGHPFTDPQAYEKALPNPADRKELADVYGMLNDAKDDLSHAIAAEGATK